MSKMFEKLMDQIEDEFIKCEVNGDVEGMIKIEKRLAELKQSLDDAIDV